MCLVTSTFYHKKDNNRNVKCFVAKEDILVYKCLDCINGKYSTPFQDMPIVFTKGKYVYNKVKMSQKIGCGIRENAVVSKGIHAYSIRGNAIKFMKDFHKSSGTCMHYAVIPKGSNFYLGSQGDVVSNNLIVYREKRCFDRHYPNIIDFNKYIDKYLTDNMYYIFNNDIEQVCNALNSYGFAKDEWSCVDKDAKAVGLVLYSADDDCNVVKCKKYVLLSESMMDKDPRFGWCEPYRKEVKNVQEFLDKCRELS